MDDNRELDLSSIFWGVLLVAGGERLQHIEDSSVATILHTSHQSEILHSLIFFKLTGTKKILKKFLFDLNLIWKLTSTKP